MNRNPEDSAEPADSCHEGLLIVAIRLIAIRAIKHFLTGYHECRLVERRLQKSNESLHLLGLLANYKDGGEGEISLSAV